MKKTYGKAAERWEKFGKGCLIVVLAALAVLVGTIWLAFFPLPKISKNPAKYEELLADSKLRTGFAAFPPTIPASGLENGAVFYYFYQDTFLDPTGEVFLRCTYSEEDYRAEIDRLEHYALQPPTDVNKKIGDLQDEPNRFVRDEKGRFSYPAYIAIYADDYACEYALLTGEREISYVYFAFREPGRFRKVPADCLPEPFEKSLNNDEGMYNIYYFKFKTNGSGIAGLLSYHRSDYPLPAPEVTAAPAEMPAETALPSEDLTGTSLPIAGSTVDPEADGTKGFYCVVRMPDGVKRLVSDERAVELYKLLGQAVRDREQVWSADATSSDGVILFFYNCMAAGPGPEYYELYAAEFCYHGMSPLASYAEKFRLPTGTYQAVLDLVSDLPTLDEALAACVRARPSGGDGTYTYDLYDPEGNYVQSLGPYDYPLTIYRPDPMLHALRVAFSGSGGPERSAQWRVYFEPASGTLSKPYYNVLTEEWSIAYCGEADRVCIYEPIRGELLGEITAFSEPLASTADSPFLSASYNAGYGLAVTYLAGDDAHTATDCFVLTSVISGDSMHYLIVPWEEAHPGVPAPAVPTETGGDAEQPAWTEEMLVLPTPAPRVEPVTEVLPKVGDYLSALHKQLEGRLVMNSFTYMVWENPSDYTVVVSRNGSTVSGYARFAKDGTLLEENGLRTIPDFDPDEWVGRPFDEFVDAFGPEHCDAGSGLYIPLYISGTGKLCFLTVDGTTIAMINIHDLTASAETEEAAEESGEALSLDDLFFFADAQRGRKYAIPLFENDPVHFGDSPQTITQTIGREPFDREESTVSPETWEYYRVQILDTDAILSCTYWNSWNLSQLTQVSFRLEADSPEQAEALFVQAQRMLEETYQNDAEYFIDEPETRDGVLRQSLGLNWGATGIFCSLELDGTTLRISVHHLY